MYFRDPTVALLSYSIKQTPVTVPETSLTSPTQPSSACTVTVIHPGAMVGAGVGFGVCTEGVEGDFVGVGRRFPNVIKVSINAVTLTVPYII